MIDITLVPNAGLCNRLNCIASAVTYQRSHPEDTLTVYWHYSRDCHCRFSDLFSPTLGDGSLHIEELTPSHFRDFPASTFNLFLPSLLRKGRYDIQFTDTDFADSFENKTMGSKKVYVCHCNRFWKDPEPYPLMSDLFIPTNSINKEIDSICHSFMGRRCIGLHIRRTDNAESIIHSPLERFTQQVRQELGKDSETLFYLATDDVSVKKQFKLEFGNAIISPGFTLKRNSDEGMRDAVIDLFCLGKTQLIYGSFASTYSTFASRLYGIPLVIL